MGIHIESDESWTKEVMEVSKPQYDFLSSSADWCFYGGSAGSGKSYALTIDPLRSCQGRFAHPDFKAALFRRTYPMIANPGGLLDECRKNYGPLNAIYNHTSAQWRFRSGAKVNLSSCQFDKDLQNYQGAQLEYVGFDEITQFTQDQVLFLWGRCRSKTGIKPNLRATLNPDADSWVYKFLYWWINPVTGYPIQERAGVVRHFKVEESLFIWFDEPQYDEAGHKTTTSATFIPATLDDNQALMASDPSYRQRLMQLSEQERERYLFGNWLSSSITGTEWPRECFIDVYCTEDQFPIPQHREVVRMFTVDASKGKNPKKGDYSAIVCLAQTSDLKYVDADLARRPPGQIVEDLFLFCENPLHRIRSGDLIGIESLQFQELFRNMIYLYADSHREFALSKYLLAGNIIIPIEDKTPKIMRIRRLDSPIRKREFRFLQNPGTTLGLQQLKQFTGVNAVGEKRAHDDFPDALEMAQNLPRHLENYYERLREGKA